MHRTKAAFRSSPRIMGVLSSIARRQAKDRGSSSARVPFDPGARQLGLRTPRAGKVNCARPELLCSALPCLPRYHAADGVLVLVRTFLTRRQGSGARVAFNSPRGNYFTHRVWEDEPRDGSSCGYPCVPRLRAVNRATTARTSHE
ncbi:hypothetical protein DFH09DRAFT_1319172 [Mycena vulgaris]|nr:hypothetical protein DFH09DRAFT_1319172 [Mycena vulgaris]